MGSSVEAWRACLALVCLVERFCVVEEGCWVSFLGGAVGAEGLALVEEEGLVERLGLAGGWSRVVIDSKAEAVVVGGGGFLSWSESSSSSKSVFRFAGGGRAGMLGFLERLSPRDSLDMVAAIAAMWWKNRNEVLMDLYFFSRNSQNSIFQLHLLLSSNSNSRYPQPSKLLLHHTTTREMISR